MVWTTLSVLTLDGSFSVALRGLRWCWFLYEMRRNSRSMPGCAQTVPRGEWRRDIVAAVGALFFNVWSACIVTWCTQWRIV
jgi:hypothetical protein